MIVLILKRYREWIIPFFSIVLFILSYFFFGFEWWIPRSRVELLTIIFLLIFLLLFETLALFLNPLILKNSIDLLKDQLVVKALIEKDLITLLVIFPLTMIFEELLFRLFLFDILFNNLGFLFALTIGTLIFSIYHIHIWFQFRNKEILTSFVLFSALLGLILNLMIYYLGLLACVIVHSITVLGIFYDISRRIN